MNEQPTYQTHQELMEAIRTSRNQLEAFIGTLTPEQFENAPEGEWNVKDNLAHLTVWEQSILALLDGEPRHTRMGISKEQYESHDIDAINHEIYLQYHDRPLDEVLAAFHASHQETLQRLETLNDEDLMRTYSWYLPDEPGEDSGEPIIQWIIGDTWKHYDEHLRMIRELFEK
jgi:hypothetical protein